MHPKYVLLIQVSDPFAGTYVVHNVVSFFTFQIIRRGIILITLSEPLTRVIFCTLLSISHYETMIILHSEMVSGRRISITSHEIISALLCNYR